MKEVYPQWSQSDSSYKFSFGAGNDSSLELREFDIVNKNYRDTYGNRYYYEDYNNMDEIFKAHLDNILGDGEYELHS